ncbi:MAG: glycosyltransferase family 4 protein [Colwellia sp.]|nr:glycosyltransferase family 4 protein [Colwellia sp.]
MTSSSLSVAHIVSSLEVGGAERFVIDLCYVQKVTLGIDACIVSFGKETDKLVPVCNKLGIKVFVVNGSRFKKLFTFYNVMKSYSIIHSHSPYPLKFLLPLFFLKKPKKLVYTRHGAHPFDHESWPKVHRMLKPYVDEMTFVSQEGSTVFQKHHGWSEKSISVIDNGVNLLNIKQTQHNADNVRLGSVGRMVELKHQICLLRATKHLPKKYQKKIEVNFFGDGPSKDVLTEFIEENLTDVTIYFHGMVSNRDDIYGVIDALVVTSETEGLSLAIMEAMAYGCLTIASNVGGNSRLVDHNINGWLFNYDDDKKLSEILIKLVDEKHLLNEMGEKAHLKIKENFSLETCANKYLKLYL